MLRRFALYLGALSAPFLPSAIASAQESRQPNAAESADVAEPGEVAEPLVDGDEVVRVRGQERANSASDVTVSRALLEASPHRSGSDLLQVVPGVLVTQHGGQGKAHQIFLRGFDAQHGQDVEIWVAGVPVNEVSNLHGQGYADLHFVMPEVVREVRATAGSYDVRQGDFAVAGTVRYALGVADPGITSTIGVGTFGERRFFVAYHPPEEPEETFVAGELQTTDGFGPARSGRRASAIGQAIFDIGETSNLRLQASAYAARFDTAGVRRLRDVERESGDARFATYNPSQGGDSLRGQIIAEFSGQDREGTQLWSIAPYAVARSLRLVNDYTGFLTDEQNGDTTQQRNDSMTMGLHGKYRKKLGWLSESDAFEVGTAGRLDLIEQSQIRLSRNGGKATATLVDASLKAADVTAYLEGQIVPWDRLTVRLGLRADGLFYSSLDRSIDDAGAVRSAMGFHLGKKAALELLAVEGLRFFANYGDGFRSPQARSLADGETTPFTEVLSFEGGSRIFPGRGLTLSAAVFHTRLSNDLVFDEALARNEPVAATARTGFYADLRASASDWLVSSTSATFSHAEFIESDAEHAEGDLVPYAPQLVIRSDLGISPVLTTVLDRDLVLHAGVGLTFVGRRPLPFDEFGHETFLADVELGLSWKEIEISAEVFNLLNADWYDGEFTYASNFEQGSAPGLIPQRHVTVGAPFSLLVNLTTHI